MKNEASQSTDNSNSDEPSQSTNNSKSDEPKQSIDDTKSDESNDATRDECISIEPLTSPSNPAAPASTIPGLPQQPPQTLSKSQLKKLRKQEKSKTINSSEVPVLDAKTQKAIDFYKLNDNDFDFTDTDDDVAKEKSTSVTDLVDKLEKKRGLSSPDDNGRRTKSKLKQI